jgi:hypothetical protein
MHVTAHGAQELHALIDITGKTGLLFFHWWQENRMYSQCFRWMSSEFMVCSLPPTSGLWHQQLTAYLAFCRRFHITAEERQKLQTLEKFLDFNPFSKDAG